MGRSENTTGEARAGGWERGGAESLSISTLRGDAIRSGLNLTRTKARPASCYDAIRRVQSVITEITLSKRRLLISRALEIADSFNIPAIIPPERGEPSRNEVN